MPRSCPPLAWIQNPNPTPLLDDLSISPRLSSFLLLKYQTALRRAFLWPERMSTPPITPSISNTNQYVHTDSPCILQPPVVLLLGPPVVGSVLPIFNLFVYNCIDDVCGLKNYPTTGK